MIGDQIFNFLLNQTDGPPDVLSISYGVDVAKLTLSQIKSYNHAAAALTAAGTTIVVSSGDDGARGLLKNSSLEVLEVDILLRTPTFARRCPSKFQPSSRTLLLSARPSFPSHSHPAAGGKSKRPPAAASSPARATENGEKRGDFGHPSKYLKI